MSSTHAFHGGKSFEVIGEDFQDLDRFVSGAPRETLFPVRREIPVRIVS